MCQHTYYPSQSVILRKISIEAGNMHLAEKSGQTTFAILGRRCQGANDMHIYNS